MKKRPPPFEDKLDRIAHATADLLLSPDPSEPLTPQERIAGFKALCGYFSMKNRVKPKEDPSVFAEENNSGFISPRIGRGGNGRGELAISVPDDDPYGP